MSFANQCNAIAVSTGVQCKNSCLEDGYYCHMHNVLPSIIIGEGLRADDYKEYKAKCNHVDEFLKSHKFLQDLTDRDISTRTAENDFKLLLLAANNSKTRVEEYRSALRHFITLVDAARRGRVEFRDTHIKEQSDANHEHQIVLLERQLEKARACYNLLPASPKTPKTPKSPNSGLLSPTGDYKQDYAYDVPSASSEQCNLSDIADSLTKMKVDSSNKKQKSRVSAKRIRQREKQELAKPVYDRKDFDPRPMENIVLYCLSILNLDLLRVSINEQDRKALVKYPDDLNAATKLLYEKLMPAWLSIVWPVHRPISDFVLITKIIGSSDNHETSSYFLKNVLRKFKIEQQYQLHDNIINKGHLKVTEHLQDWRKVVPRYVENQKRSLRECLDWSKWIIAYAASLSLSLYCAHQIEEGKSITLQSMFPNQTKEQVDWIRQFLGLKVDSWTSELDFRTKITSNVDLSTLENIFLLKDIIDSEIIYPVESLIYYEKHS